MRITFDNVSDYEIGWNVVASTLVSPSFLYPMKISFFKAKALCWISKSFVDFRSWILSFFFSFWSNFHILHSRKFCVKKLITNVWVRASEKYSEQCGIIGSSFLCFIFGMMFYSSAWTETGEAFGCDEVSGTGSSKKKKRWKRSSRVEIEDLSWR